MKASRKNLTSGAPSSAAIVATEGSSARSLYWIIPIVILLLTGVAFSPVLQNQFVNWDDRINLLDNRYYRGLGLEQLRWMFTTFHNSLYRPLTWITLGADYLAWGMQPSGYHLTSLVFHCANAFLVYLLLARLLASAAPTLVISGELPLRVAAAFGALVFAVHPLRVEPVAWASGRENVVFRPFFRSDSDLLSQSGSDRGAGCFLLEVDGRGMVRLHPVSSRQGRRCDPANCPVGAGCLSTKNGSEEIAADGSGHKLGASGGKRRPFFSWL